MKPEFMKEFRRSDFEFARHAPKGGWWAHDEKESDFVAILGGIFMGVAFAALMFLAI